MNTAICFFPDLYSEYLQMGSLDQLFDDEEDNKK